MNCSECRKNRMSRHALVAATLALTTTLAIASGGPSDRAPAPDLSIGAAQFPDEDAIILRWEQHWTLEKDGTVHRRDHQWVKLLNARPIPRFADPRLDFRNGQDELVIHAARTHLPNGTVLPVPDYSFNRVGPDDVAGWPEYLDWQQMVVSFSGIEPDAVLELDYEVITPPGVLPWVDADVPLQEEYPIVERLVTVSVPDGGTLNYQSGGSADSNHAWTPSVAEEGGMTQYRWSARDLPGARGEPQSPPWQRRSGRLRFSTCPSAAAWVSAVLDRVNDAAQPDDAITKFAESTVEDEADPVQRVRKLAKKMHDSFNFVDSFKTMRSLRCRRAADVLRANYGNPLESAALCLAALRSLGFGAAADVAVDGTVWDVGVPTDSVFAGVVVVVDRPLDDPIYVHPQLGVFRNPGGWGQHWLLSTDASGSLDRTYIYARGETRPSELQITGKITVDADGRGTGELRLHLTGLFYDPLQLETAGAQKAFVGEMTGRLLAGFDVTDHSITTLSDEVLRATVKVGTEGALKQHGELYALRFGDGPAFLADVPMPLDRSYRRTDVQLAGSFREEVDLAVELPDGWKPSIVPASLAATGYAGGTVSQAVDVDDKTIRLRRHIAALARTLAPDDFEKLRRGVNDLRAAKSLILAFGPDSPDR